MASRDLIVVSTLGCGRSVPGSNPGHVVFLTELSTMDSVPQNTPMSGIKLQLFEVYSMESHSLQDTINNDF